MSEQTIDVTREQLEALGGKLDALDEVLSDDEKTILLAIFAVAGEALAEKAGSDVEGFAFRRPDGGPLMRIGHHGLPNLNQGFQSAFAEGGPGRLGVNPAANTEVTGSITVHF